MREETLEEKIEKGNRVRELILNVPGWKDVEKIISEMREEAFNDWSTLPLDAPIQKTMEVRSIDIVLRRLMERINSVVTDADEAREHKNKLNADDREASLLLRDQTTDVEIERLGRPLSNAWSRIFGREPVGPPKR